MHSAILLLEDGTVFRGQRFGAQCSKVGEVVFNTAMTGYQEALTDPSYCEQILIMTHPHIGNTGVNSEDVESKKIWLHGFIAREFCENPSNYRSEDSLENYLLQHNIPAIHQLDTRSLVLHIRNKGAMKAIISTEDNCLSPAYIETLQQRLTDYQGMIGRNLAYVVCNTQSTLLHTPTNPIAKINIIDAGCKSNIVRLLQQHNFQLRSVPITASLEEWTHDCDIVFISNGPGDPASLEDSIEKIRAIYRSPHPKILLGICLGHQLLALALGARTYKLPFGHRGTNHPVLHIASQKVSITSQNHGFCVDAESLQRTGATITHTNLNDNTVAGLEHPTHKISSVQFHPEASPGPHDSLGWLLEQALRYL